MKNADMTAIPVTGKSGNPHTGEVVFHEVFGGLTKREHFAAMAMRETWWKLTDNAREHHFHHAASMCVKMADAMLAELERTK